MNQRNQQQAPQPEAEKNLPAEAKGGALKVYDFGDDAGAGMEDIDRSEYTIPFVRIIQVGSPQAKPKSVGGLELKAGTIFNLGTNEAFDGEKGVTFIPVKRDHNYPEFIPRNPDGSGGGFVGIHQPTEELVLKLKREQGEFGKLKNSTNGTETELGETFYLYGILVGEDGQPSSVVVGFASTQIKKFKAFMTRYMGIQYPGKDGRLVRPPLWAHRWKLTTVYESKGAYSWYGWRISLVEEPSAKSLMEMDDPLYEAGKACYESLRSGSAKANFAQAREAAETNKDEVPF